MNLLNISFNPRNFLANQCDNPRRNFAQKVPQNMKEIYFHMTKEALLHLKSPGGVSCSIATARLPLSGEHLLMTRLGGASLPTSERLR